MIHALTWTRNTQLIFFAINNSNFKSEKETRKNETDNIIFWEKKAHIL